MPGDKCELDRVSLDDGTQGGSPKVAIEENEELPSLPASASTLVAPDDWEE